MLVIVSFFCQNKKTINVHYLIRSFTSHLIALPPSKLCKRKKGVLEEVSILLCVGVGRILTTIQQRN